MEVTREDAGRAGPSTAKAASPTGRERQPREAGPPIIDAADAASRGDLTAEVVESKLTPGPIGSTINEEVPQFTRAARILSLPHRLGGAQLHEALGAGDTSRDTVSAESSMSATPS